MKAFLPGTKTYEAGYTLLGTLVFEPSAQAIFRFMRQTDVFWVPLEKPCRSVKGPPKSEHFYPPGSGKTSFFNANTRCNPWGPCRIRFGLVLSCRIVHSADGNAEINCAEAGARVAGTRAECIASRIFFIGEGLKFRFELVRASYHFFTYHHIFPGARHR